MGENVILMQNKLEKPLSVVEKEMNKWLSYWFEWFRPWREEDVCHQRKIWTRWVGVPIHAWNERFFKIASSKIGAYIQVDENTKERLRLDVARVMVSVPWMSDSNIIFTANIDGKPFKIKVTEELQGAMDLERKAEDVWRGTSRRGVVNLSIHPFWDRQRCRSMAGIAYQKQIPTRVGLSNCT
ncbi:hypothetical protein ACS0TY_000508 [Phlomoides rotata]